VSTPGRFSRPALDDGKPPGMTVAQARDNLIAAAETYRESRSEKDAWAMEAAAWTLIAATYEVEEIA
jgi:hypothetical protein